MSRTKWRIGFLPNFKNDRNKKKPLDNGSVYHEVSNKKHLRHTENTNYEELF